MSFGCSTKGTLIAVLSCSVQALVGQKGSLHPDYAPGHEVYTNVVQCGFGPTHTKGGGLCVRAVAPGWQQAPRRKGGRGVGLPLKQAL